MINNALQEYNILSACAKEAGGPVKFINQITEHGIQLGRQEILNYYGPLIRQLKIKGAVLGISAGAVMLVVGIAIGNHYQVSVKITNETETVS